MNKLTKGLFMTIVVFIATTISTTGIPVSSLAWEVLGITSVGTVMGYLAQSALFPTTSIAGTIDFTDILKGMLVAVANVLSTVGAVIILHGSLDWKALGGSVITVLVAYFAKQFVTKPADTPVPQPSAAAA
ncbi:MAG: hypothetical protein H7320_19380 [Ferruginibacter sp.]|nr:hypothetical protein [Ferruginibacter sp.]